MLFLPEDSWEIKVTPDKGRGVFAKKKISKNTLIGDYLGVVTKLENLDFEQEKQDMYAMYYNDTSFIYPTDIAAPGVHLINHSCDPNCTIYPHKGHILFIALRDIKPNEELTIDYKLAPAENCNPCTHQCFCGSKVCRGTMHLSESDYQKSQERFE